MKRFVFCVFLLFALYLSGCGKQEPNSQIYDYFPFSENVLYVYEGEGHPYASYTIYNTIINGNRLQRLLATDVQNYNRQTEVFEVADGELALINGDTFSYHLEDMTDTGTDAERRMIILKEPLKLGATWVIEEGPLGQDVAEVTGVDVALKTPSGNFNVIEVTHTLANGSVDKYYYAKGVGLVRTEYPGGDDGYVISSTLSERVENTAANLNYRSFSPAQSGKINYATAKIALWTNYDLVDTINAILSNSETGGQNAALLKNGKLKEISFAANASAARLNFDTGIYEQEYKSADEENANLSAIALTVGYLFGVDNVFIQVEGRPYSGVYVKKTEDDYFISNLDLINAE